MVKDLSRTKKEIKSFLLINFSIIAIFSILLFISRDNLQNSLTPTNFATVFMVIPALAAMITLKHVSKLPFNKEVDFFFKVFMISAFIQILVLCIGTFLSPRITTTILSSIQGLTSIILIFLVLIYGDSFDILNLRFTKNIKKVFLFIIVFMILRFLPIALEDLITKEISFQPQNLGKFIGILTSNFLFGFVMFFGEEFGWRYFLQPKIQTVYGKRFGIIILGAIWGIWHAPLCFTLYSPETPIHCVFGHVSTCIAFDIFMAYVYIKTENLWTPILLHLVNNCLIILFMSLADFTISSIIYTTKDLIIQIFSNFILFGPFLLSKVFKKDTI